MFYTQAVNFGFLQLDASLPCLFLWHKKKADLHAVLTLTMFGLGDQKNLAAFD